MIVASFLAWFGFVLLGRDTRLAATVDLLPPGLFVSGFAVARDLDLEVVLGLLTVVFNLVAVLVETCLLDDLVTG